MNKLWYCLRGVALAVVVAMGLAGCAINPVTGEHQLMLLSEQEESQLGQATDQSVIEQYGLYENAGLHNYMKSLGLSMGRNSHRPNLNWQFKVMDSPVVNAFAAPGGYIYVTRGLMAAVNDEAELAGVLGHEIGHVTARHSAQQYSKKMLANIGLGLGQSLMGDYGEALNPIMEAGAGLLFLKFSRDDEREADALGVEYATRAGYDAGRMADFFITLQRQSVAEGSKGARLPDFFSTHPNPVNREADVRRAAQNWQAKFPGTQFRVSRKDFLRQIDGLVYGEDPREGFQEGNWYYLPKYQVQLPVPLGWSLEREGNNIQLAHPQQRAVALFAIRSDSSIDEVVASFLKATGAVVQQNRTFMTSGMPTRFMVSSLANAEQRAVVVSKLFQKGRHVFAFHGLTDEADFDEMSELMQQPAQGFSLISDQAMLNRQPQRVLVKTVSKTASMERVLQSFKVDPSFWSEVAWLNGRRLGDTLSAGEMIKIVQ